MTSQQPVIKSTDSYALAGQQLTREAAQRMNGHCLCGKPAHLLVHYSMIDLSVASICVCKECSKRLSIVDLFNVIMEKANEPIISNEPIINNDTIQ